MDLFVDESHEVLLLDVVEYPAHIDHAKSPASLNANTTTALRRCFQLC